MTNKSIEQAAKELLANLLDKYDDYSHDIALDMASDMNESDDVDRSFNIAENIVSAAFELVKVKK